MKKQKKSLIVPQLGQRIRNARERIRSLKSSRGNIPEEIRRTLLKTEADYIKNIQKAITKQEKIKHKQKIKKLEKRRRK